MIITVDLSFLDGILHEYYESEESTTKKHWCFISVNQEKDYENEFIEELDNKKVDYFINNYYHQNNQQLFDLIY